VSTDLCPKCGELLEDHACGTLTGYARHGSVIVKATATKIPCPHCGSTVGATGHNSDSVVGTAFKCAWRQWETFVCAPQEFSAGTLGRFAAWFDAARPTVASAAKPRKPRAAKVAPSAPPSGPVVATARPLSEFLDGADVLVTSSAPAAVVHIPAAPSEPSDADIKAMMKAATKR